jgi:hypothetical protein
MSAPDTIALGELSIGDCFCFAGRRVGRLPGEYVPQWKVLKIAPDFCEAALKNVPGTPENSTFPGLPIRLASSTKVYRVEPAGAN